MSAPPALQRAYEAARQHDDVPALLRVVADAQAVGARAAAEQWLIEAFDDGRGDVRVAVALLEMLLRYRSWREFDQVADKALARNPAHADLLETIGLSHEQRGQFEDAAIAFGRAAEADPDHLEVLLRQTRLLRLLQRPREALDALRALEPRHRKQASFQAALGYVLIALGRTLEAARHFQRAVDLQPDWPTYLDDLAGSLMLSEKWVEAARTAIRSLKIRKQNERAWTVYAVAHHRLGQIDRADQGYRNAIRAARDPSRAKGNYGLFLATRPEEILKAVRMLREALEAHPDWEEVERTISRLTA